MSTTNSVVNSANSTRSNPSILQNSPNSGDGMTATLDLDTIEKNVRRTGTYTGALLMTASLVPIVAALVSAVAFIVQWPRGVALPDWLTYFVGSPLLLGTVPTLLIWFLLAFFISRFTAADRMDMGSYGKLINRLVSLDAQLSVLDSESTNVSADLTAGNDKNVTGPLSSFNVAFRMASSEALNCRNAMSMKLVKKSLGWVTANGYINIWKELHDAEEALIDIMPRESVIANAIYDEMCIQDSKMDNSDELLRRN